MTKEGDVIRFDEMNAPIAPGVTGYFIEHDDAIYYPVITATNEGSGDVGRFLDSLVADATKVVKVPNVLNDRLVGMLQRRGFVYTEETTDFGEVVDVWVYQP